MAVPVDSRVVDPSIVTPRARFSSGFNYYSIFYLNFQSMIISLSDVVFRIEFIPAALIFSERMYRTPSNLGIFKKVLVCTSVVFNICVIHKATDFKFKLEILRVS